MEAHKILNIDQIEKLKLISSEFYNFKNFPNPNG